MSLVQVVLKKYLTFVDGLNQKSMDSDELERRIEVFSNCPMMDTKWLQSIRIVKIFQLNIDQHHQ